MAAPIVFSPGAAANAPRVMSLAKRRRATVVAWTPRRPGEEPEQTHALLETSRACSRTSTAADLRCSKVLDGLGVAKGTFTA
jgi:hypothetical protein